MWKDEVIVCVVSLAALVMGGCRAHHPSQSRADTTAQETGPSTVSPDQVPADVRRTMHEHIMPAEIISAKTMTFKGGIVYVLYVRSGNNVYTIKIRPDGNYLGMSIVGERP